MVPSWRRTSCPRVGGQRFSGTAEPLIRWAAAVPRFQDRHYDESEFVTTVWVECQCGAPGVVRSTLPYWSSTPTFTCSQCGLTLRGRHTFWAGPSFGFVRRRCTQCGRWLHHSLRSGSGYGPKDAHLKCGGCGRRDRYPVEWGPEGRGEACDPTFGLRLRLQVQCVGHTLWALNPEHVAYLRSYVEATVRERIPNANASTVSRLPKWLKLAKNRQAVLSALQKLAKRAAA